MIAYKLRFKLKNVNTYQMPKFCVFNLKYYTANYGLIK